MKKLIATLGIIGAITAGFDAAAADLGIAWVGKSGMSIRVLSGLQEKLTADAPDINIEIQKELATMDELDALAKKWAESKQGMVLLRSTGAKYLGANPPKIPAFVGGANHPVHLGAVASLDAPGGNVTGVTYFLPHELMLQAFMAIAPGIDNYTLLVEKGHPGSAIDAAGTEAFCKEMGLTYSLIEVTADSDLSAAVASAQGGAILIGNQALLIDAAATIVAAAPDKPVFGFNTKTVPAGATAALSADDKKLGGLLGDIVIKVLKGGEAPASVPIGIDADPLMVINMTSVQKLGLSVDAGILSAAKIIE
ncbi:MAG: hypothetical protein ISR47_00865 [Rhodospirillales bacterium]|nr:hypothetical protein [Rhodospirillales bacterium]